MRTSPVERLENQYWNSMNPALHPSGYKSGYLLVGLIAAVGIVVIAYGCSLLVGSTFLIGLVPAGLVCGTKMYFVRYRTLYERTISSGWDRVIGYLICAFLSVFLAALGFFGISDLGGFGSRSNSTLTDQWQESVIKIESYYGELRSQIESRIRAIREMIVQLQAGASTSGKSQEIRLLENELYDLNKLLRDIPLAIQLPKTMPTDIGRTTLLDRLGQEVKKAARLQTKLPDGITADVELPKIETLQKREAPGNLLRELLTSTLSQSPAAIGCWILPAVLEILTLIIILHNRPRYYGE